MPLSQHKCNSQAEAESSEGQHSKGVTAHRLITACLRCCERPHAQISSKQACHPPRNSAPASLPTPASRPIRASLWQRAATALASPPVPPVPNPPRSSQASPAIARSRRKFRSDSYLVFLLLRPLRAAVPQHPNAADFARPLRRCPGALGRGLRTGDQLAQTLFTLRLCNSSSGTLGSEYRQQRQDTLHSAARHSFRAQAGRSANRICSVCLPGVRSPQR